LSKLVAFHKDTNTLATVTAVQPPGRFGGFVLSEGQTKIEHFHEKPVGDGAWISGGFFVLEPKVLDYIENDATVWEQKPMMTLASEGNLSAFRHDGFWHPMDTLRDKHVLDDMWKSGKAPWKNWK
jgi:glucose-1-phosphate cytidylyltransferase